MLTPAVKVYRIHTLKFAPFRVQIRFKSRFDHLLFKEKFRTPSTRSSNVAALIAKLHTRQNTTNHRMGDSYIEDYLRFRSIPEIAEEYRKTTGGVRMGKLLEDLDALAAVIGFAHAINEENRNQMQVVTASLDRIDMKREIPIDRDIKISGYCTFVGRSSMEVSVTLTTIDGDAPPVGQEKDGYEGFIHSPKGDLIMEARFTMVS
jgi:acyl-coenzyme A thioesterase 9